MSNVCYSNIAARNGRLLVFVVNIPGTCGVGRTQAILQHCPVYSTMLNSLNFDNTLDRCVREFSKRDDVEHSQFKSKFITATVKCVPTYFTAALIFYN